MTVIRTDERVCSRDLEQEAQRRKELPHLAQAQACRVPGHESDGSCMLPVRNYRVQVVRPHPLPHPIFTEEISPHSWKSGPAGHGTLCDDCGSRFEGRHSSVMSEGSAGVTPSFSPYAESIEGSTSPVVW